MEERRTVITCHNLSYSVTEINAAKYCSRTEKTILNNINGVFKPGLNAILGATGSGKTTLLDVLAGRKDPRGVTGHVLVNGESQPYNFKCMTGYVVQDDMVMGTLTVRENIMFSANTRLSSDVTYKHKKQLVDDTINELGLNLCADSKVGNQFIRGVSGGERKRTSIGMELIVSPSLLFLDEPTSGLDSNTANSVMWLLSRISKRGRTIIFSIHQPRYSIYKLFDSMFLLAHGRTVYHGPMSEATHYFSNTGYVCEEHNNPPDFFLDVINGDARALLPANSDVTEAYDNQGFVTGNVPQIKHNTDLDKLENGNEITNRQNNDDKKKNTRELADNYLQSPWCMEKQEELNVIYKEFETKEAQEVQGMRGEFATGFLTQLRYLAKRTTLDIVRNPANVAVQIGVHVVLALLPGFLFFNMSLKAGEGIQNRTGVIFLTVVNILFPNLVAVEVLMKERQLFIHEHSNGFYRTLPYFVSKVVFDLVPFRIIPTICYSIVIYFMVGLQADAEKLFIFMLTLVMTSLNATSLGFMIGSSTGVFSIAHLGTALCYILQMLLGGFLVSIDSIWVGIRWLQYLSVFKYGLNALFINEFKDMVFYDKNSTTGEYDIEFKAGEVYLENQNIDYATPWDLWVNILAMGLLTIGYLIIAFIQLTRINKYR